MFKFKYDRFHEFYTSVDSDLDELGEMDVFVYDQLKKYDERTKTYGKFSVTNVRKVKRFDTIADKYEDIYPYGMFVVTDYRNPVGDKWLLFVYPVEHEQDEYLANHFTFLKNGRDCHFHMTEYDTVKYDMDIREHDDFPDGIMLPEEGYEDFPALKRFTTRYFSSFRPSIIDIIRYPWDSSYRSNKRRKTQKGGAPVAVASSSKRRRRSPTTTSVDTMTDTELGRLFRSNYIDSLIVFVYRKNGRSFVSYHEIEFHKDRETPSAQRCFTFVSTATPTETLIREHMKRILT